LGIGGIQKERRAMASYFCDGSIATQSLIRPERPVETAAESGP